MQLNQQFKLAGNNFVACCFFSFVLILFFYAYVCFTRDRRFKFAISRK